MSKVKTTLKRFANLRDYKVLSDVILKDGQNQHKIDYVMIGEFGILCLCGYDGKGELYGNENDRNFVTVDKKMNRTMAPNLIKTAKKNQEVLRSFVADKKFYNIKIETAIVIENKNCQPLFSASDVPVVKLQELSKFLNKEKFELDNKVKTQEIFDAIVGR